MALQSAQLKRQEPPLHLSMYVCDAFSIVEFKKNQINKWTAQTYSSSCKKEMFCQKTHKRTATWCECAVFFQACFNFDLRKMKSTFSKSIYSFLQIEFRSCLFVVNFMFIRFSSTQMANFKWLTICALDIQIEFCHSCMNNGRTSTIECCN